MYLMRSITVNWGNLPPQELEYGPVNLFTGGNSSGKTTTGDALQTLMTAAHDNLFTYNPGQDETTQRGRHGKQVRTLASYVLGCDDGAYGRLQDTDCYLAAVFHPTKGERAEPFTAIMGVRAHLDHAGTMKQARLDDLQLFIIPGEMLTLNHFVRTYPDGRHVVPLTDFSALLKQEFGVGKVEAYENKKQAYLGRLYGALRGRRESVSRREAMHAARSFAGFMAYKPVKSIDEFVAEEVLEKKDVGDTIRKIRDLLKTVHNMEAEANILAKSVDLLGSASSLAEHYIDRWLDRTAMAYGSAAQTYRENQRGYAAAKEAQQGLRLKLEQISDERRATEGRLEQAHEDRVQLEARRQGIAALKTKDELEGTKADLLAKLGATAKLLLEEDVQFDTNLSALESIQDILKRHSFGKSFPELESAVWRETAQALMGLRSQPRPELHRLFGHDWTGDLSALDAALDGIMNQEPLHKRLAETLQTTDVDNRPLIQRLWRLVDEQQGKLKDAQSNINSTEKQINDLEASRVSYPPHVEEAINVIRRQCPQADPRVLCDYVEVVAPEWQMAIEGYIGGARFSILVEPDFEAEAIRIVRALPGQKKSKARVIQGSKARQDSGGVTLPKDSILEVMRFSHKIAEYYLRASYGTVLRVKDAETLRSTRRGITQDGLASGNYSMWRCDLDDAELVFGQGARDRAKKALQKKLEGLKVAREQGNSTYQASHLLHTQATKIRQLTYATQMEAVIQFQQKLRGIEAELNSLDLTEYQDLNEQLESLKRLHKDLQDKQGDLNQKYGACQTELQGKTQEVKRLDERQGILLAAQEQAERELREATRHAPGFDPDRKLAEMDQRLDAASGDIDFKAEDQYALGQLNKEAIALEREIGAFNQIARPSDILLFTPDENLHSLGFFRHVNALLDQLRNLHNRLRNNVLLEKREQLASLRDSFNTAFVSDLCHEIHQAITDGERTLSDLNKELKHHQFGADRERFEFEWQWIPEFKEYWQFFKEVVSLPNLGDGATLFDAELSSKGQEVRDRVLSLLLDGDEQQAIRELERISDYRHYRRYDILKLPDGKDPIRLSEYGTGSGGQLETPAYIIRAAAVTSAFRFNEGDSHLRMVVVDEAFMHMDEPRSREVINYLTATLGLQLIFIMPSSKSGPFMDLISNQFIFSKVPSAQPIGELKTRVLVDRQALNIERINELWANHRRVIRNQAELDFMAEL